MVNIDTMRVDLIQDEKWERVPIKGLPNYMVSNFGRVYSEHSNKLLKLIEHRKGYLKVYFGQRSVRRGFFVHRLVALAFIENPNRYPSVNHINCNKKDNHFQNLEWCTNTMNIEHGVANGRYLNRAKGQDHYASKLSERQVLEIRHKFNNGYSRRMLAVKYQVSRSNIKQIISRHSWKHV